MEVDLQQLRTDLEKELQELEQQKSALKEQMAHIESVERMASGILKPGEVDDQASRSA